MFFPARSCTSVIGGRGGRRAKVVGQREVLKEVREQQHGQIQTCVLGRELGILQCALLIVGLDLRLDHVGVRHFAGLLELAAQIQEALRLIVRRLHAAYFGLRRFQSVIGLDDGNDQASCCDLGVRAGQGLCRSGPTVVRKLSHSQRLLNSTLADVLVNAIVGDENAGRSVIALGIGKAVVVIDARQQGCARLHPVLAGKSQPH